ncbi:MAG: hypothetical protein RIQ70_662 [Bacteroidota bacterium]
MRKLFQNEILRNTINKKSPSFEGDFFMRKVYK